MKQPTVLLVEADPNERRRFSRALHEAGYEDLMLCPGPFPPSFTCFGSEGRQCALTAAADVIVVDLRLRSDVAMKGTPGWHLFLNYYATGKPIVALWGIEDAVYPHPEPHVTVLTRPVASEDLIAAVERARTMVLGGTSTMSSWTLPSPLRSSRSATAGPC